MACITDKDLFYNKWRIPAGTPVGMTTLLMHTDAKLYPNRMFFNPDRWMGVEPNLWKASDAKFAPFSRGTRMCLGHLLPDAPNDSCSAQAVICFDHTKITANWMIAF
ncbi:hypothetical protein HYALB_00009049 [Hymenoscyphus albidus]|uniref:Cytochrome P450 n=1 Tax=Hymenoscyphus albidus TaxID=595503 RepID=A0A9N9LLG5_9HELO|nr:hypothetical protein HYALB_00009049 [Hymenoscyphus albidus]